MDPVANLREQRELAASIIKVWNACAPDGTFTEEQYEDLAHDGSRLAELVQALDTWRVGGGFDPYTVVAR